MTTSFIAALGALRAHQSWIDVIGNNLANTNTPAFKSSRALFADLFSITYRPGTPPTGSLGGTNPLQQGLGVQLASVDRMLQQGALNATGRTFDLALQGRGLFAVDDGTQTLYTRVGAFGLDSTGNMIDLRSGFRVLDATGQVFHIDTREVFPPSATTRVEFLGQPPGHRHRTAGGGAHLVVGLPGRQRRRDDRDGLRPVRDPLGETWTMELVVNGGAPQSVSIAGALTPLTAQDVVDQINDQTEDVVASVGSGGEVVLTSERTGTASTVQVTPGASGSDLKSLLGLSDFIQGTETLATAASDLNDLTVNRSDYANGDLIQVSGTDVDGAPVVASFVYGTDGTTIGDLVSFLESRFEQSTVAFDAATGEITVTADETGEASLSLSLTDPTGQAGRSDWSSSYFAVTTNGTGPDKVTTSVEVFDPTGAAHVLTCDYVRQEDGTWNLAVSLPPEEGTVVQARSRASPSTRTARSSRRRRRSSRCSSARSGADDRPRSRHVRRLRRRDAVREPGERGRRLPGRLRRRRSRQPRGAGRRLDPRLLHQWPDAHGGELRRRDVRERGWTRGGGRQLLPHDGQQRRPVLGAGQAAGAGQVLGETLEASNVDTAEQFVHLIQAQRGFQANARVITVQDELLADIVNVV
jgi:flagellar hook protein FlgE